VLERLRPDVAVIDHELAIAPVLAAGATSRVLVLAQALDGADAHAVLAAGASGYLSKDREGDALLAAILAVARGDGVLDPAVQSGLAAEVRLRRRGTRPVLSPREREILEQIARGRSAPEIARHFHLGLGTVKTHLLHLYEKLGVSDRAAAVAAAMRAGVLE
jgi:two-component system nitrate/nitrite response regulator NarL